MQEETASCPLTEGTDFESRLEPWRQRVLRMTEGGRYSTHEERLDISHRLDMLEGDLNLKIAIK